MDDNISTNSIHFRLSVEFPCMKFVDGSFVILRFVLASLSKEKPFFTALKSKLPLTMNEYFHVSISKRIRRRVCCYLSDREKYHSVCISFYYFSRSKIHFHCRRKKKRVESAQKTLRKCSSMVTCLFSLSRILYKEVATSVLETFVFI